MRTIKFRAWDEDNKRMGMVRAMDWAEDQIVTSHLEFRNGDIEKVYPEETVGDHIRYMQFTGLLDKNGKEIYEGDVVKWEDGKGWVVYHKEFARFSVAWPTDKQDFYGTARFLYGDPVLEIIGNIYENPDLLTTSSN